MTKKSGLDMIQELLKEMKLMNKKINVLDANVKKLMNTGKVAEIATKALNTPLSSWTLPTVPIKPKQIEAAKAPKENGKMVDKKNMKFGFESVDGSKVHQAPANRRTAEPTTCMCQGKMVATDGPKEVPLPGLSVKIFNEKDKMIKETKTNRAGSWMSQLPPGRYVANIEGKFKEQNLYPINLNFEVKQGMEKLEVT